MWFGGFTTGKTDITTQSKLGKKIYEKKYHKFVRIFHKFVIICHKFMTNWL